MAVAVRGGSLEKGVFIDTALPSSPWALLGASHLSPPLQTRITASASVPRRPSLQRLLNTRARPSPHGMRVRSPGRTLGRFWSPPKSQGPFDGFNVTSSYPIQGFSFKRKDQGTWEGPTLPRSTGRGGNLEMAEVEEGAGKRHRGKEGSFCFVLFFLHSFFFLSIKK